MYSTRATSVDQLATRRQVFVCVVVIQFGFSRLDNIYRAAHMYSTKHRSLECAQLLPLDAYLILSFPSPSVKLFTFTFQTLNVASAYGPRAEFLSHTARL